MATGLGFGGRRGYSILYFLRGVGERGEGMGFDGEDTLVRVHSVVPSPVVQFLNVSVSTTIDTLYDLLVLYSDVYTSTL